MVAGPISMWAPPSRKNTAPKPSPRPATTPRERPCRSHTAAAIGGKRGLGPTTSDGTSAGRATRGDAHRGERGEREGAGRERRPGHQDRKGLASGGGGRGPAAEGGEDEAGDRDPDLRRPQRPDLRRGDAEEQERGAPNRAKVDEEREVGDRDAGRSGGS